MSESRKRVSRTFGKHVLKTSTSFIALPVKMILNNFLEIQYDDPRILYEDPVIKALIKNNNGGEIPSGYYSHVAVFVRKPDYKAYDLDKTDFSLHTLFISSCTILNRRWAVSKATPIVDYRIEKYWLVAQPDFDLPLEPNLFNSYEIHSVLIHPEYQPDRLQTEVVLVRVAKDIDFTFDVRSVNLGFLYGEFNPTNCKMPVWSWFFIKDFNDMEKTLRKGEISVEIVKEDCINDLFICLKMDKVPCGINAGMPIICNTVLVGVFIGENGDTRCTNNENTIFTATLINTRFYQKWFEETFTYVDKDELEDGPLELRLCE